MNIKEAPGEACKIEFFQEGKKKIPGTHSLPTHTHLNTVQGQRRSTVGGVHAGGGAAGFGVLVRSRIQLSAAAVGVRLQLPAGDQVRLQAWWWRGQREMRSSPPSSSLRNLKRDQNYYLRLVKTRALNNWSRPHSNEQHIS